MRILKSAAMAALALGLTAGTAIADSFKQGDLIVRGRAIMLAPTADSNGIAPDLLAGGLEAQTSATPELDFTYMVTDNIGVELILATSKHSIDAVRGIAGVGRAAEAWLLPPTLLAQYHFDTGTKFKPYIGAGINYTVFFDEEVNNLDSAFTSLALIGADDKLTLDLDPSIGLAVQAGFNYKLNDKWGIHAMAMWADIAAEGAVELNGTELQSVNIDVDPIVLMVGAKFYF